MGVLLGRVMTGLCDAGKPRGGGSSERVAPLGNEGGVAPQKIAGSDFCAPQKIAAFPLKCVLQKNSGYSPLFYFFLSKMCLNSHFISTNELTLSIAHSHLVSALCHVSRSFNESIETKRIAFTANGKREIRVYVFSKKRIHG